MILRLYRKEGRIDDKVNTLIMNLFKYAVIMHLANGFWLWGSPLFFPDDDDFEENTANEYTLKNQYMPIHRFMKAPWFLIALALVIVALFLKQTVIALLSKLCCCGKTIEYKPR